MGYFTSFRRLHPVFFKRILMFLSIALGIALWQWVSIIPGIGSVIVGPANVYESLVRNYKNGFLIRDIKAGMTRVFTGFGLAFIISLPVAFLMGWYGIFRVVLEPWIQFFRTIPPIALIPLVIVMMGIRESAKVSVIFFCSFLVMVIAIYQGVTNVDEVIIKAARTFGAKEYQIFLTVVIPASFPYILVAARLGMSTALTSLIASEMTGASRGLGNMIQEAALYFDMSRVILGIAVIGTIGLILDKTILFLEKRLTQWQEVRKTS